MRRLVRGVTLVELVVAMVLLAIILSLTVYFFYPVTQAVDVAKRAQLTDIADNALQRIRREVRLALPNSVRVTGTTIVEFIPVRTAGRYRAESSGAACGGGTDELAFGSVDGCFKTIGQPYIQAGDPVDTDDDWLVLNNYGENFTGQNAYETSLPKNLRRLTGYADANPATVTYNTEGQAFSRDLHDSPGRRFFIVKGNNGTGQPEAVRFECSASQLTRRWGYDLSTLAGGSSAVLAERVAGCVFTYTQDVAAQIGLLTLRLTLSDTRADGTPETVSLYHAVHVVNVP